MKRIALLVLAVAGCNSAGTYLEAENAYTGAILGPAKPLDDKLRPPST